MFADAIRSPTRRRRLMDNDSKNVPAGFTTPVAVPSTPEQRKSWQESNRRWWQSQPMRYDFTDRIPHPEFSAEFYEEIDRRFFQDAHEYMPWRTVPFDPLIDFPGLRDKDVLEVGVGNGSHAALLARHAKSFTGIDLTDYAVNSTSKRLQLFGIPGTILQMDAEQMSFPDNSFDFIWSWGVIHHSADTERILAEMARITRPGGRIITMVYHRSVWNYYVIGGLIHGLARGRLLKYKSLHATVQHQIDGAIARYYTTAEWRALASRYFKVDSIRVCGSKLQLLQMPPGRLKDTARRLLPDAVARFFTNACGWGTFLVSELSK